ncbi:MAG TPA: hypothetical protein VN380_18235 [Thermoanaerobaculia bacterium]|jgi:hypothetical protein|nr:hypothetical protein [Thermoanaerobaculia bacterium]
MATPRTTKTLGPLHFEDLEPHRFEDLVRELAYDYKDWQSIEATGRSGSDEGWDIRAFERSPAPETDSDDDDEPGERPHPMEGNAWMFQVKREKSLGPSDVKRIVAEVDADSPPYGYILAAPTNFSKKSYDVFRADLRAKGVREFYVWGRAELEDMLHMPKNDRILFAFFGISLVSRRRSRTSDVRAAIVIKNKLYRAVGEGRELYKEVLLRDLNDAHYPYSSQYPDFEKRRRWRQLTASGHHPLGISLHVHRYYAYLDRKKKEWDFTPAVDLCDDEHSLRQSDEDRNAFQKKQVPVLEAWKFLPHARQAMFVTDGLLRYADITAIDEKGDVLYECPHIFVEFGARGPFAGWWETLEMGNEKFHLSKEFKRVKIFPKEFETPSNPTEVKVLISLDEQTIKDLEGYQDVGVLYAIDGRYKGIKVRDVVGIQGATPKFGQELLLQITHVGRAKLGEYMDESRESFKHRRAVQQQVGKAIGDNVSINYLEYERYHMKPQKTEEPVVVAPEE